MTLQKLLFVKKLFSLLRSSYSFDRARIPENQCSSIFIINAPSANGAGLLFIFCKTTSRSNGV